eukprot:gene7228-6822_t
MDQGKPSAAVQDEQGGPSAALDVDGKMVALQGDLAMQGILSEDTDIGELLEASGAKLDEATDTLVREFLGEAERAAHLHE